MSNQPLLEKKEEPEFGIPDEGGEAGPGDNKPFTYNTTGLSSAEAKRLLEVHGLNQLPEKKIPKWKIFLNLLIAPMPLMIFAAAAIEAAIGNTPDMGILLFINFANAAIGFYETTKAADAVEALKNSLKPKATVKRDGKWQVIDGTTVVPGDMVLLASGSAMPADCRVNVRDEERKIQPDLVVAQIDVDQAALTGESLPVTLYEGDKTLMGSTVVRGETEGTVEYTGIDTFFGKTAGLLAQTEELSNVQYLLISIVRNLTILSLVMCTIVLFYVMTIVDFMEALSFVVVLMVASIPMAMEIVTTTTLALGAKELTKHGAIVTRLAAIEDMAGMAILCSDKTGTLTLNQMQIQEYTPVYSPGETQYSLLRLAAMAAKWKEPARDALDKLVLGCETNPNGVDLKSMECIDQLDYLPFDPIIKRTEGTVVDKSGKIDGGKRFKTSKGAPQVLLKLVRNSGGCDAEFAKKIETDVTELGKRGIRAIAVAKTSHVGSDAKDDVWKMMGLLTFLDPPRPDTKETVRLAKENGVAVKMITGDHLLIAMETSRVLDMGGIIAGADGLPLLDAETKAKPANLGRDYGDKFVAADGFAQTYPEHKYLIVEGLRELGYRVGMTGDGVNDSPALKRADVGIAVFGATDAAKAAADIVLTEPGLSTIVDGILISRRIWCRVRSFLTYRIAATLQLLCFFFIAVFAYRPNEYMPKDSEKPADFDEEWPPFFHMPVLMLMLITLLNDGTLITIGYDIAVAPKTPPIWNMPFLFSMAFVQSFVAMISSVLLLDVLLHSWDANSLMRQLGLGGISYGKITTSIYLKVSVSDFLTLFSARAGGDWFFMVKPAPILLVGAMIALTCSTCFAMFWPKSSPDHILTEGLVQSEPYMLELFVWSWSLAWWLVEDAAKVFCRWIVHKYNIFNINDTGVMVLTESAKKMQEKMKIAAQNPTAGHHRGSEPTTTAVVPAVAPKVLEPTTTAVAPVMAAPTVVEKVEATPLVAPRVLETTKAAVPVMTAPTVTTTAVPVMTAPTVVTTTVPAVAPRVLQSTTRPVVASTLLAPRVLEPVTKAASVTSLPIATQVAASPLVTRAVSPTKTMPVTRVVSPTKTMPVTRAVMPTETTPVTRAASAATAVPVTTALAPARVVTSTAPAVTRAVSATTLPATTASASTRVVTSTAPTDS